SLRYYVLYYCVVPSVFLLASPSSRLLLFFFNDTATTEIYTLSLHDALPISLVLGAAQAGARAPLPDPPARHRRRRQHRADRARADRKSTRLNSSHVAISYAVFCLKKKNNPNEHRRRPDKEVDEGNRPGLHSD